MPYSVHPRRRAAAWGAILIGSIGLARAATDLENLAVPGAAGDEAAVAAYVVERLGPKAALDATGSVRVTFGEGEPSTLLATGLDEPGFAVSEITDDGYLRVHGLAEPAPSYQFADHWFGQPVWVSRREGPPLAGVVAAPSVHFSSDRGYSRAARGINQIHVDLGASSRAEVARAGVGILDRVVLRRSFEPLGERRVSGAWISSRAGAAVLLALADRLAARAPTSAVTLVFAAQQHYGNAGLTAALRREAAARAVVIRPGGGERAAISGAAGRSSALAEELLDRARSLDLPIGDGGIDKPSFGPFPPKKPWPDPDRAALVSLGVEHAGTPIESVSTERLAAVAELLADWIGIEGDGWEEALQAPRPSRAEAAERTPDKDSLTRIIEALTATPGVSGAEAPVREAIRERLPEWVKPAARVDASGNLVVPVGGSGDPAAVFIAHLDEIGYRVTRVGADGELSVESRGGLDESLYLHRPAVLWGEGGPVPAVLTRGAASIGAASAEQAVGRGAAVGAAVTVPKLFQRLLGERIAARSLDDRAGCAVLLDALDRLRGLEGSPVWFVFSVEEETGLIGAAALAEEISPRRVYAVDSLVTSDSPLEPTRIAHVRLGGGAAIRALDNSGITPRDEVERVVALAARRKIPVRVGVTAGGNDGTRFALAGAVNIPLSFPLRYAHSAVETADLRDLRALRDLIVELARAEISEPR